MESEESPAPHRGDLVEQYGSDVIDAALILTSAHSVSQQQSGPSEEVYLDYTETEFSEEASDSARRVTVDGELDMAAESAYGSPSPSEDTRQSDEDRPMSFVEQARSYGLCRNYLSEDPFASTCMPSPPDTAIQDLEDPPGVHSIALLDALNDANALEKWDVDKESAGFLASVLALGKDDGSPLELQDAHVSFRDLKIMEPLLHCDPELELQQLRRRNQVRISAKGIPPFTVKDDEGEGVKWSLQELEMHAEAERQVTSERLDVPGEVSLYLRELVALGLMTYREMLDVVYECDMASRRRAESPPLMPISPQFTPQALPASVQELEFTSSPEDLIMKDATDLDRRIMEADESIANSGVTSPMKRAAGAMSTGLSELYSGLNTPVGSSSSPLRRKLLQDVEVEVPLMPVESLEPPTKKAKTTAILNEVYTLADDPDSDMSILDPEVAQQDLDAYIKNVVMPFAESALKQTENEQLIEVDTTMRVAVPLIEFVALIPPWDVYGPSDGVNTAVDAQRALLFFTKRELMAGETPWSGVSKLERVLTWSPFSARLAKVTIDEQFDDDGSAERYMTELIYEDELDLNSLVSKTEGLRLLDACESDDDKLEPIEFEEDNTAQDVVAPEIIVLEAPTLRPTVFDDNERQDTAPTKDVLQGPVTTAPADKFDVRAILQRRKLELERAGEPERDTLVDDNGPRLRGCDIQKAYPGLKPSRPSDLFGEGGIANYMRLQGEITAEPARTHHQVDTRAAQMVAPTAHMVPTPVAVKSSARDNHTLPSPELHAPERAVQIVVPIHILGNRVLIRQLQALLPNLDLVARNPVATTSTDNAQHKRQEDGAEADITISPRIGLLTTTLSKLKQRPLPNQSSFFGIRDRVAAVSSQYERLVVLVSEGRQTMADEPTRTEALDQRDCDALSDLMGFAAQLDVDVDVRFVPGGEDELIKWVAATILQHCTPVNDAKLLQEETIWERFLRVAGMNAFAAQAVLMALKQPDNTLRSEGSSTLCSSQGLCYGLPAFVRMSSDQRIQQFGPMLGGEGVITRVSQVVDGGWVSSNGRK